MWKLRGKVWFAVGAVDVMLVMRSEVSCSQDLNCPFPASLNHHEQRFLPRQHQVKGSERMRERVRCVTLALEIHVAS